MFAFTELKQGDLSIKIHKGIIQVVCNHILGFSDPPPLRNGITFRTECNQKLPFSEYIPRKAGVGLDTLFFGQLIVISIKS